MSAPQIAKLTSPEAGELFGGRCVAFLPIGSTEPHGPHLPLDTDVTIALEQSRRAALRLAALGVRAFVLPPLAYGLTYFTDGFPGRVGLRPGTLWALLEDVVSSLEEQGVVRIVFSNAHLEPDHVKILRGVLLDHAEATSEAIGAGVGRAHVIFPDVTRRRPAERLGEEFRSGDCHAGRYESSLVLAADAPAVRDGERRSLPAVRIDLLRKLRAGVKSFREAGAERAYCGDPAAASAAEGDALYETLADLHVEAVREAWPELFA